MSALVSYDPHRATWTVQRRMAILCEHHRFIIPKGFETDLSSIPRWLWWLIAPFELSVEAPLVHDWLYRHGGKPYHNRSPYAKRRQYTRADADRFLYTIAAHEGVWWWRRWLAYNAVRLFGARAWIA